MAVTDPFPPLPVDSVIPDLRSAMESAGVVVLTAEPGAGKTTRVPLAFLGAPLLSGKKLILLEPRRLAARRAAEYMAHLLGEQVGNTVGYRIRGESRITSRTRIEVVTEGILTRMLHEDPLLAGTGIIIFDEFHERSLHADTALAFTCDVRSALRPDLPILIMSATLDGLALSSLFPEATFLRCTGKVFPVETRYLRFRPEGPIELRVADVIRTSLQDDEGDILVFLPGRREIRRVHQALLDRLHTDEVVVHVLHGDDTFERQQEALRPAPPGVRKVILSTNVAETSLTIDGIRVVVDAGLVRTARFDARRGMTGLVTVPVSRASADQRRGRAGRLAPGICYRLWREEDEREMPAFPPPEILTADLASFALDLARWGTPDGTGLRFLDPPPPAHLARARKLLHSLGAVTDEGKITAHGQAVADVPTHPRFAHMILTAAPLGLGSMSCDIAALLEERDLFGSLNDRDVDLRSRLHAYATGSEGERGPRERARQQARRLRDLLSLPHAHIQDRAAGLLLGMAYPDRIARRRDPQGPRYLMASGTGAVLPEGSLLAREEFLAIAEADAVGTDIRIFLADALNQEDILQHFGSNLETDRRISWDSREGAVVARQIERLGAVIVAERQLEPTDDELLPPMLEGIRQLGLAALPWTKDLRSLCARSEWLRLHGPVPPGWPDMSDASLLATVERWLAPFLRGCRRQDHLRSVPLKAALESIFSPEQFRELDRLAPASFRLPNGARIHLQYTEDRHPILAVRVQDLFGVTTTPTVAHGTIPVVLHMLSPARRPLAVTGDLRSFWTTTYPTIRQQMKSRYPKHQWPENPMAPGTASGRGAHSSTR